MCILKYTITVTSSQELCVCLNHEGVYPQIYDMLLQAWCTVTVWRFVCTHKLLIHFVQTILWFVIWIPFENHVNQQIMCAHKETKLHMAIWKSQVSGIQQSAGHTLLKSASRSSFLLSKVSMVLYRVQAFHSSHFKSIKIICPHSMPIVKFSHHSSLQRYVGRCQAVICMQHSWSPNATVHNQSG